MDDFIGRFCKLRECAVEYAGEYGIIVGYEEFHDYPFLIKLFLEDGRHIPFFADHTEVEIIEAIPPRLRIIKPSRVLPDAEPISEGSFKLLKTWLDSFK